MVLELASAPDWFLDDFDMRNDRFEWTDTTRRDLLRLAAGGAAAVSLAPLLYGCSGEAGNGGGLSAQSQAVREAVRPHLKGDIAAMAIREQADDLGALAFNDATATATTLGASAGQVRLVNIWATWCAPCREEMPWLDTLQKEMGGERFSVVAISVDGGDAGKPRAFYDEIGIADLAFFHDPTLGVFNTLKKQGLAFGLPVTLLVGPDNRVIANMNGPAHWAGPDARAMIAAAVGALSA